MDEVPMRVLLVEDDEEDYAIIKALLSEAHCLKFHLDWLTSYEAGLEAMRGREHDLCLLDYMLGARTGLEFIRELSNEANETPIIILTGQGTHEVDIKAMRSGASDYLVKGHIDADLLERSIRHAIERKRVENQLARYQHQLEQIVRERTIQLEQANKSLQEEHDRLDAIIEFLPDATFVIDINGKVIAWNRAMEEMAGVSKADMLQQMDHQYAIPFYGERRPVLIDLILKPEPELKADKYNYIQRQGDLLYGETYAPRVFGGKGAYLWSAASVLKDSSGNIVGAIQSLRDITERKRMEEERLRLEQQLRQVEKAESLGRMAGAIAHNFNNKLMAVMGNLELVLETLPQESNPRTSVLRAMQASHQATEISRLMLACIGQAAEKKEPIYLAEIIRETLPSLAAALPRNVHIKTDIPVQGPNIFADPMHIKQILTNLVLNASEALGDQEGNISVTIREMSSPQFQKSRIFPAEWEPKAKSYACLSVSDTGCGLDTEIQKKIFDPFFSTKFTGRGLGLSVVLGLVRTFEGAIDVNSQVGLGTTFQVFFPLSAVEKPAFQNDESPVSDEIGDGLLVLFVDDDPLMRELGKDMLTMLGCGVIVAADGAEAVEILRMRKDEVSLVVLDLNMPRMNGWETLTVLRSVRPNISVVIASGHDENQAMQNDYPDRPQSYLQKPYRLEDLKAALDHARKVLVVGREDAA